MAAGEGRGLLRVTPALGTCATTPSPVSHATEGEPGRWSEAPGPTAALAGAYRPVMDQSVPVDAVVELCNRYRSEERFVSF